MAVEWISEEYGEEYGEAGDFQYDLKYATSTQVIKIEHWISPESSFINLGNFRSLQGQVD